MYKPEQKDPLGNTWLIVSGMCTVSPDEYKQIENIKKTQRPSKAENW